MACDGCTKEEGAVKEGCKSNGTCNTGDCGMFHVFDWLSGMELPMGQSKCDVVEVRFKNNRKAFYRLNGVEDVNVGDVVTVEVGPGHDVGIVSVTGELVRMQMQKKSVKDNHELKKLYRKSNEEDIQKWHDARESEWQTMITAREIAISLGLVMKLSDVEYQGDRSKATFYYTAEGRVDFRELIKRLADSFKVRIEMRQFGMRQEASRLGAIGSCGRELCCATWMNDFRSVSTSSARYQQLSLNPGKLAGQCGKLKCCLNFELDQYIDAIKEFPSANTKLKTGLGRAFHFKTDIFKGKMYFIYEGQMGGAPVALNVDAVKEIIEMNQKGEIPESLTDFEEEIIVEETPDYMNVVGQDSLTRFDSKRPKRKKGRRKKPQGKRQNPNQNNKQGQSNSPQSKQKKRQAQGQGKGNSPSGNRNKGRQQNKPQAKGSGRQGKPSGQNKSSQNKPQNKPQAKKD